MKNFIWESLISENVVALMEAKKDETATDYTTDIREDDSNVSDSEEGRPVDDNDTEEPSESEDYTDEVSSDQDDDEPTDYSEDSPDGDDDDSDDEGGSDEDTDANDYTDDDSPTDGGNEDENSDSDDSDSGSDDSSEDGEDSNPSDSVTNEEEVDSKIKNLDLHDTYVYLYNRITDFETKLSIIQNSSYMVGRIITQVNKNLVNLRTAISEYLIYSFDNNSYVRNLYNYNHFLESLRLNMIIMGKIKDLIPDAQNN